MLENWFNISKDEKQCTLKKEKIPLYLAVTDRMRKWLFLKGKESFLRES